jgi:hypothetical protein
VVNQASEHLAFDLIGEVRLKGFSDETELFIAHTHDGDEPER